MKRADFKPLPGLAELNRLFEYDPETGALRWKVNPSNLSRLDVLVGRQAGNLHQSGYMAVNLWFNDKRQQYFQHRLIWKMMTGSDPVAHIDHIDTDRANNRWANLRAATESQNAWNGKLRRNNSTGVKGVYFRKGAKSPWVAVIGRNYAKHYLGCFQTKEYAVRAWQKAAAELHGEFARAG